MPELSDEDKLHLFELSRLEYVLTDVMKDAEDKLRTVRGELNVLAADKRHALAKRMVGLLYTSCVNLGLKDDADCLVYGHQSPTLEKYRVMRMMRGLSSR